MESKDESKEIDIKKRTCYYFDDVMKVIDIYPSNINILLDEKSIKKTRNYFNLITFHTKLLWVHYHCVVGSMK